MEDRAQIQQSGCSAREMTLRKRQSWVSSGENENEKNERLKVLSAIRYDEYRVPFAFIVDGTIAIDRWQALGLKRGPLPLEFLRNDSDTKQWWFSPNPSPIPATRSSSETREKHFSPRIARNLYNTSRGSAVADASDSHGRWHRILPEPIALRDLALDVADVFIWAFELVVADSFAYEPDNTAACEVILHLEARVSESREQTTDIDLVELLKIRVAHALRNLTRDPGPENDQPEQFDPFEGRMVGGPPASRKLRHHRTEKMYSDSAEGRRGRSLFVFTMEDFLNRQLCGGEQDSEGFLFLRVLLGESDHEAFERHGAGNSPLPDSCGTIRRIYSVVPWALPRPHATEREEDSGEQVLGALHHTLITGDLNPKASSVERAISNRMSRERCLIYRDGASVVFEDAADTYNCSGLAYCLGIYLDQFVLCRMSTRLIEQLGMNVSEFPDTILMGASEQINRRERTSNLSAAVARIEQIDNDLVKFKASYWQTSAASSRTANLMIDAYRKQHPDEKALQVNEEKVRELSRIVNDRLEFSQFEEAAATRGFLAFLALVLTPFSVLVDLLAFANINGDVATLIMIAVSTFLICLFLIIRKNNSSLRGFE